MMYGPTHFLLRNLENPFVLVINLHGIKIKMHLDSNKVTLFLLLINLIIFT